MQGAASRLYTNIQHTTMLLCREALCQVMYSMLVQPASYMILHEHAVDNMKVFVEERMVAEEEAECSYKKVAFCKNSGYSTVTQLSHNLLTAHVDE